MKRFIEWYKGNGATYIMLMVMVVVVAIVIATVTMPSVAYLWF